MNETENLNFLINWATTTHLQHDTVIEVFLSYLDFELQYDVYQQKIFQMPFLYQSIWRLEYTSLIYVVIEENTRYLTKLIQAPKEERNILITLDQTASYENDIYFPTEENIQFLFQSGLQRGQLFVKLWVHYWKKYYPARFTEEVANMDRICQGEKPFNPIYMEYAFRWNTIQVKECSEEEKVSGMSFLLLDPKRNERAIVNFLNQDYFPNKMLRMVPRFRSVCFTTPLEDEKKRCLFEDLTVQDMVKFHCSAFDFDHVMRMIFVAFNLYYDIYNMKRFYTTGNWQQFLFWEIPFFLWNGYNYGYMALWIYYRYYKKDPIKAISCQKELKKNYLFSPQFPQLLWKKMKTLGKLKWW